MNSVVQGLLEQFIVIYLIRKLPVEIEVLTLVVVKNYIFWAMPAGA
jgi:hypothetical protein